MQKPSQRKTVQWSAQEIQNAVFQKEEFRKKALQFQAKKVCVEESQNSDSDQSQEMGEKSQKTIEIEMNLKKAKINRVSLRPGQPINLKEINRRISHKENIPFIEEVDEDLEAKMKKEQFQKKRSKLCDERFPVNKKN